MDIGYVEDVSDIGEVSLDGDLGWYPIIFRFC